MKFEPLANDFTVVQHCEADLHHIKKYHDINALEELVFPPKSCICNMTCVLKE